MRGTACGGYFLFVIFAVFYLNGYAPVSTVLNGRVITNVIRALGLLPEHRKGFFAPEVLIPAMARAKRLSQTMTLHQQSLFSTQMQVQMSESLCAPLC